MNLILQIIKALFRALGRTLHDEKAPPRRHFDYNKKAHKSHKKATQSQHPNTKKTKRHMDDSVIDVTGQYQNVPPTPQLFKYEKKVPRLNDEHLQASNLNQEQSAFYETFKHYFSVGKYLDLDGNTNYAVLLMQDLLKRNSGNLDVSALNKQMNLLTELYPKLIEQLKNLEKRTKQNMKYQKGSSNEPIKPQKEEKAPMELFPQHEQPQHTERTFTPTPEVKPEERQDDADTKDDIIKTMDTKELESFMDIVRSSDAYPLGLGTKYQGKLNLSKTFVSHLDAIYYAGNMFFNIEECQEEIIKLYSQLWAGLNKFHLSNYGKPLDKQIEFLADEIARKQYRYRRGSENYLNCVYEEQHNLYLRLIKICENQVRERYFVKRRLKEEIGYKHSVIKQMYENIIVAEIPKLLMPLVAKIKPLSPELDTKLYLCITKRWKQKLDELLDTKSKEPEQLLDSILVLAKQNVQNKQASAICRDAAKSIAKKDLQIALILYVYSCFYLHRDEKGQPEMPNNLEKIIAEKPQQLNSFKEILADLAQNMELEKALNATSELFAIKRRKIELDTDSIQEVQTQHAETVQILSQYLEDEDEMLQVVPKVNPVPAGSYSQELAFNALQSELLALFAAQNFSLPHTELDAFAKAKRSFRNQLVESINDLCYDELDDLLIEEEENVYTVNPNYYQRIFAK